MFSKKWISSILILILYIFSPVNSFCQGVSTAVPYLTLQQSPLLMGAGQVGAAIASNDAMGFYYNPAQLGYFSRENSLSTYFMPAKTEWVPNILQGINYLSSGITAGYNFNRKNKNLPLSIGVGYLHNRFDYSEYFFNNFETINNHENYEAFDCFSIGLSYKYYLLFNLGFSIKSVKSKSAYQTAFEQYEKIEANGTAYDAGAMIIAPVSDLFFNDCKYQLGENSFLKPKIDFTLGYSLSNIGKEISYTRNPQKSPLPRIARLGYSLNFGIDLFTSDKKINTIDYSFTAEAEDILIEHTYENNPGFLGYKYQRMLSDLKPVKNLIQLKDDENIVVHRGHIFKLFETILFTSGRYHGRGFYEMMKTNGIGISSEGLFKLAANLFDTPAVNLIADHFIIEYYSTNFFADTNLETKLKGFAVYLKGIEI